MTDISLAVIPPSTDYVSEQDSRLAAALASEIEGEVRFGRHDRMLYATDASIYQVEPLGVVLPKSLNDLRVAVQFAADHRLPVLARGGGTSLAGQTVNRALVIDTSKYLRRITDIDPDSLTCRVEPGAVLDHLNAALAPHGLRFGPDVATSAHATLGGMIGNNSSGAHSLVYGRTVENLETVDALLATGEAITLARGAASGSELVAKMTRELAAIITALAPDIRARFSRTRRRVNGYNFDLLLDQIERSAAGTFDHVNLAHLVCGSEGTLAITAAATLRLVHAPSRRGLAIVAYASVDEALAQLEAILATSPAAVELLDDVVIRMGRANTEYARYVELLPRAMGGRTDSVLYVEYFGDGDDAIARELTQLEDIVRPHATARYTEPAAMALAWKLRKAGEPLLHGVPGHRKPITFIEDTAVDPSKLAAFVRDFRAIVTKHGTTAAYYAHASVGCLHIRPLVDPHDPRDHEKMQAIASEVTDLVVQYGGALSGEHGDGRVRSPLLERYLGRAICEGFALVKRLFDPDHRLNPGNIVADYTPSRMTERLRVKPQDTILRAPPVETFFRYPQGFEDALEQCNGAGVCRKTQGGTMCPSYRATLDERHSTRGRGNALRLAITGQLSARGSSFVVRDDDTASGSHDVKRAPRHESRPPSWDDRETLATLDLCLSCKACKSECPSNVDVAKLKAEYHGQRFRALGRVPLRTRLIGRVRTINRIGSAIHPVASTVAALPPTALLIKAIMGIDRRRSLPRFGSSLFKWMRRRQQTTSNELRTRPAVILFSDCFTTYGEPHIGRAAVETLEAFGYRVILPDVGCCSRSLLSVGMMEDAQQAIARTAGALLRVIDENNAVAVVGCEPSCISAIKDDWLDIQLPSPPGRGAGGEGAHHSSVVDAFALRALAAKTFLIEEFLDRFWETHSERPAFAFATGSAGQSGSQAAPIHATIDNHQSATLNPSILLHGHCHQKALWGIDTSANLLRRIFGAVNIRALDTGCCGMAGSFGYSPHRYDLSMKIGELSLFPVLRQDTSQRTTNPEPPAANGEQRTTLVAAPGTSCRHQIRDGVGAEALHPIEVVAAAIHAPQANGDGAFS